MDPNPRRTFEEDLEWCILQLETGLLLDYPPEQQVQETQRILGILKSPRSHISKKRGFMNEVYVTYQIQTAKARRQKILSESPPNKIQEVTQPSHSVSDSQSTSTPSDNFFAKQTDGCKGAEPGNRKHSQAECTQFENKNIWMLLTDEKTPFRFNFQFPGSLTPPLLDFKGDVSTAGTSCDNPNTKDSSAVGNVANTEEALSLAPSLDACSTSALSTDQNLTPEAAVQDSADSVQQKSKQKNKVEKVKECKADTQISPPTGEDGQLSTNDSLSAVGNEAESQKASSLGPSLVASSTSGLSVNQNSTPEAAVQNLANSVKQKNKKKGQKKKKKEEECKADTPNSPPARENGLSKAIELQREVDWCIEQLEISLLQKRTTPRQAVKSTWIIEMPEIERQKRSRFFQKRSRQSNSNTRQVLPADSQDLPSQSPSNQKENNGQSSKEQFSFNFF
ncbi:UPF0488 protein C8orf33 homolog isoform X2 [Pyxicephalus adspersus]|uniref:UPF0488 protein C8orf33 homolog isoform X2 n=1 Tax=Pyxicephalus adspersus TaxID=30357 RepID=UPI003B59FE6B